jgi:hypothetical protein
MRSRSGRAHPCFGAKGHRKMEWISIRGVWVAVRAYVRKSGPVRRHVRGWPRQYRLPGID